MIRLLMLAFAAALIASAADGRPNCKKGVPCGNTCISAGMECRMTPPIPPHRGGAPATTQPAVGPYRLDNEGRCIDANGQVAKQYLCVNPTRHHS